MEAEDERRQKGWDGIRNRVNKVVVLRSNSGRCFERMVVFMEALEHRVLVHGSVRHCIQGEETVEANEE